MFDDPLLLKLVPAEKIIMPWCFWYVHVCVFFLMEGRRGRGGGGGVKSVVGVYPGSCVILSKEKPTELDHCMCVCCVMCVKG